MGERFMVVRVRNNIPSRHSEEFASHADDPVVTGIMQRSTLYARIWYLSNCPYTNADYKELYEALQDYEIVRAASPLAGNKVIGEYIPWDKSARYLVFEDVVGKLCVRYLMLPEEVQRHLDSVQGSV